MLNTIKDWIITAVAIILIIALFMFGGVLLTAMTGAVLVIFIGCMCADVVLGICHGVSSLFRRSKATTKGEER